MKARTVGNFKNRKKAMSEKINQFGCVIFLTAAMFAGAAGATPGGVDSNGCHNSNKVGYHCHPERAKGSGATGAHETVKQREQRMRRECKGRPNAGACLGYAR